MKYPAIVVCMIALVCTVAHADTPPEPAPLAPGAPLYYTTGNELPWQPVVPPDKPLLSRDEADALIRNRARIDSREGLTAIESYIRWRVCEPERGRWDFSYYDLNANAARDVGLRLAPLIVAGPAYATPRWFRT